MPHPLRRAPRPYQEYLDQQQHKALGGASSSMAAVSMASGEGAPGHGWVREDQVRATLSAIEGELALAMGPPRKLAGSRLLRLRLLLLAVESTDLCLEEALRSLRAALRRPPPPLA
jgi:hypothetical protein